MKKTADLSVYVILDVDYLASLKKDPIVSLKSAIKGGATAVQLRAKHLDDREYFKLSLRMKPLCKKAGVAFIINDRADIAALISADGVHVGAEDLPVGEVRKIVDKDTFVGVSATGVKESLAADKLGADYIGIGPVYATGQKDKPPMGPEAMGKLMKKLRTPVVAIGGINGYNIPQLKKMGVRNFSFISAALKAGDISAAVRKLKRLINTKEK